MRMFRMWARILDVYDGGVWVTYLATLAATVTSTQV